MRWIQSIENHISALEELYPLNNQFQSLIKFIIQAPNLFLTGIGKNKDLMFKISKTFNSVSIQSHFIDPIDAVHGDLGLINDGDYILATSKSGTTKELISFFQVLKQNRNNIKIFLLHCNPDLDNSLIDEEFCLPLLYEADHLNLIPTVSLVTMEVILHSAAVQIIEDRKFSLADLHKNHPGGNIGTLTGNK